MFTPFGIVPQFKKIGKRSLNHYPSLWCSENNLSLNVEKTKEIVVDFRRVHTQHAPLTINGATVDRVEQHQVPGCAYHRGPLLD